MDTISTKITNEKLVGDALARVKAELAGLKAEDLLQVNLDVQIAAGTALGALPEIRGFRERIAKELPAVDLAAFDKLEDYVLALSASQATFQTAALPTDDLEPLTEKATGLRELFLSETKVHVLRGLIDSQKIDNLRGAKGRMNVAADLQALCTVLKDSWPQIQGKTGTTLADLEEGSRVAVLLTRLVGQREQAPALVEGVTEQRQRAFTLMLRTYEEARAAIGYLRRHEGDAEVFAPTLYSGRGKKRVEPEPDGSSTQAPAAGASSPTTPKPSADTTQPIPVVTPAAPGLTQAKTAPAAKDPFLST